MKRIILLVLLATACQTENVNRGKMSSDYIVFGHFYGECVGEKCVEIYRLTSNSLYEDKSDSYPSFDKPYNGDFELLDNSLFERIKDLRDEIPTDLLTINSAVIGQPDAGDWGGIYFEMEVGGEQKYWLIDKMKSNIPKSLRPFIETIENKIQLIND